MNDEFFNAGGDAAEDYARLLGHRVIIYYQDQRGTDRKLVGKIVEIDGDRLWLENTHIGASGICCTKFCKNARIASVAQKYAYWRVWDLLHEILQKCPYCVCCTKIRILAHLGFVARNFAKMPVLRLLT